MTAIVLLLLLTLTSCCSQQELPVTVNPFIDSWWRPIWTVSFWKQRCFKPTNLNQHDNSWYRIAYLNLSDSTQQCPSTWFYLSTPIRGCGRKLSSSRPSCDSTIYSSAGRSYSQVCGRINAYQFASPNGFNATLTKNIELESYYLDGISLTRGAPGAREHVWSFVNAYYELTPGHTTPNWVCPCMYSNSSEWPYTIPSFIGNNYFCATGNRGGPATGLFSWWPSVGWCWMQRNKHLLPIQPTTMVLYVLTYSYHCWSWSKDLWWSGKHKWPGIHQPNWTLCKVNDQYCMLFEHILFCMLFWI